MDDWQIKANSFNSRIKYLFESSLHADCQFVVENESFNCHKLILATASPVFEIMFFGSLPEPSPILIKDIEPSVFKILLRLIYGDDSLLEDIKQAFELYNAANKYMVRFVEKKCLDYMLERLTPENVIQMLEFATFHAEEALEAHCLKEIRLNAETVLAEESLLYASENTLMAILDMNRLNISSEIQLFRVVKKWLELHGENEKAETTRNLLGKIRFLVFTKDEFVSEVASSDLLTDGEKLGILLRIVNQGMPPMNSGLCEKKNKRECCRNMTISKLRVEEISKSVCDGSEWITSIFTCSNRIDLLGVEVRLQTNETGGDYQEKLMIKIGLADDRPDVIAEGRLDKTVPYNSKKQIFFQTTPTLEPFTEYSIHVFLFQTGVYPLGHHESLACDSSVMGKDGESKVKINFVTHTSWESTHPIDTTILSGVIFTEPI